MAEVESCSWLELAFYALEPDIQVIAPWREWDNPGG